MCLGDEIRGGAETVEATTVIIDAHNHPDWHGHNLDRVLRNMDDLHIDKAWLLPREAGPNHEISPGAIPSYPPLEGVAQIPFSRCVSYAERAPDRFVLGCGPDPRRPTAVDELAAAVDIYGVRICGEIKFRMMVDSPDALRLFRFAGEKGLPVVVHLQYGLGAKGKYPRPDYWYGGGIDAFERALEACPDTVFLGHGPGFWAHMADDGQWAAVGYPEGPVDKEGRVAELLRAHENLYADLSAGSGLKAISRDPDHGMRFVLEFQDKLLYARDCFHNEHQECLNGMGLPEETLAKIYAGNALTLVPDSPSA